MTRPTNPELHRQVVRETCCRFGHIERFLDCHENCDRYVVGYREAEIQREIDFPDSEKPRACIW